MQENRDYICVHLYIPFFYSLKMEYSYLILFELFVEFSLFMNVKNYYLKVIIIPFTFLFGIIIIIIIIIMFVIIITE